MSTMSTASGARAVTIQPIGAPSHSTIRGVGSGQRALSPRAVQLEDIDRAGGARNIHHLMHIDAEEGLGDRDARGQGRKVEAHESGLVVASGVANEDGWVGAHWLQRILIVGVGVVSDTECGREGGTRERTDERRAQTQGSHAVAKRFSETH
jgi:hypothetical protein